MAELYKTSLFSDANLVAYYKLEDVSDSKGSNTLTNTGTTTFSAAKFNNGADFGISNTTKRLGTTTNLGITTGAMSMSCWVKGLSAITSGTYEILQHSHRTAGVNTDVLNDILYEYNGGTKRIGFRRYTNASAVKYSNLDLGTTDFIHIVYVYNGSTTVEGYINGVSIGTVASTSTTYTNNSNNRFTIAAYGDDGGYLSYASILVDDVAIFSRALNAAEVLQLYQEQSYSWFLFM